jgi:trimethylamine:corrinoid methyltransferase-like protein
MSTFDMKTSACVYGCPEYRLALSACADLFHFYGIPMWGTAGVSDSHCIDQQAGMEWAEKAIEKTKDILANHRTTPLATETQHSLNTLRLQAEIDLKHIRFDS